MCVRHQQAKVRKAIVRQPKRAAPEAVTRPNEVEQVQVRAGCGGEVLAELSDSVARRHGSSGSAGS
jgi:hypothetical protein